MAIETNNQDLIDAHYNVNRAQGSAVAAVVLGMISLFLGPLGLIPITIGFLSLRKLDKDEENNARSLAWVGIVLGCCGVLGTFVWWYAISNAISRAEFLFHKSAMHSQLQALVVYAGHNQDQFPEVSEWPSVLIDEWIVEQELFDSVDEDGDGVTYFYLGKQSSSTRRSILLYEDPKHWEDGILVGFSDMKVELIGHEEFERMLAEQLNNTIETP